MMTEELEQLLKNLRLRRVLEVYGEQLKAAEKEDVSYSEFLTRLVRAQWHARQEGALEWRIRRANLPERLSLETFPFARQPGVNRKQIRAFAELEFIGSSWSARLASARRAYPVAFCSKRWKTATVVSLFARRICSTRCMRHWRTVPHANC